MRWRLGFCLLLLAPLAAGAQPLVLPAGQVHGECKRLTKQMARYKDVAKMAHERGDELWEASTKQHVKRLTERRARRCPELVQREKEEQERAMKIARMIKKAAKAAATYFMPQ
jgi:hypothetical protein